MGAGLYDRDNPTYAFIDHLYLNIDWADLEPNRESFSGPGWEQINGTLQTYPNARLRLRIFAGGGAPRWLDAISGPCVTVTNNSSGISECVPRFWEEGYLAEYDRLMAEVARRYDGEPRVLDVVDSACMTIFAEPFIVGGPEAGRALYAAGLREDGFRNCLVRSVEIHAERFENTRVSLATHMAWQIPTESGIDANWPKERDLLNALRERFGDRLIIQNNGLAAQTCSETPDPATAGDLYCYMKAITTPKGFQQGCGDKVAECSQESAVQHGLALGGCFVEHAAWRGLSQDTAQSLDAALKKNCQ